jgi:anti-sigma factor RsiW
MKEKQHVHDLTLERYRQGELPAAEAAALRAAIATDEALRDRLAALERSDAEILATAPPPVFAAAVERRARTKGVREVTSGPSLPWFFTALPLLGAGVLALAAGGVVLRGVLPVSPLPHGSVDTAPSGDRLKGGGLDLLLYRKAGEATIEQLVPGALARPLDVLQLAYQAGGQRFGVILSIDGRGAVTLHLPESGDQAAPLRPGGTVALPHAYELDDAPRLERFYFVAAPEPFAVRLVLAAASSAGFDPLTAARLPVEARFAQASFLLRKDSPR